MAPMYLDIARTALLHLQQQQQCILQSPAADLTAINMICGDLGAAVELANSTSAGMAEVKQWLRDAAPGEPCRLVLPWLVLQKLHLHRYLLHCTI